MYVHIRTVHTTFHQSPNSAIIQAADFFFFFFFLNCQINHNFELAMSFKAFPFPIGMALHFFFPHKNFSNRLLGLARRTIPTSASAPKYGRTRQIRERCLHPYIDIHINFLRTFWREGFRIPGLLFSDFLALVLGEQKGH